MPTFSLVICSFTTWKFTPFSGAAKNLFGGSKFYIILFFPLLMKMSTTVSTSVSPMH